jgi:Arc/MetJ-type ribon-helix-helix transcriptional regulator
MTAAGGSAVSNRIVLRLNQQQLELIDRSVEAGEATDRAELIRRSLREFVQSHPMKSTPGE